MKPEIAYTARTYPNPAGGWATTIRYPGGIAPRPPEKLVADPDHSFHTRTRLAAIIRAYLHARKHARTRYNPDDVDIVIRHTVDPEGK